jgi:hypothetical protein
MHEKSKQNHHSIKKANIFTPNTTKKDKTKHIVYFYFFLVQI